MCEGGYFEKSIKLELLEVLKSNTLVKTAKIQELELSRGDPIEESNRRAQQYYAKVDFNVNLLLENSAENTTLDAVQSSMITSFSAIATGPVSLKASTVMIILEQTKSKIITHVGKKKSIFIITDSINLIKSMFFL